MTTEIRVWIPDKLYARYEAAKPDFLDQRSFLSLVIDQGLTALMSGITLPAYRVGAEGATTSTSEVGFSSSTSPGDKDAYSGDEQASPLEQGSLGEDELIKGQPLKKGDSKETETCELVGELLVTPTERGLNPRALGTNPRALDKNPRAKTHPYTRRNIDPALVPDDLLDCQQLLPEFWSVKKGVRSESVFNRICNKLRAWTPDQRRDALERAISSGWGDVFEPKPAPGQKPYRDVVTERMERLRAMGLIGQEEE